MPPPDDEEDHWDSTWVPVPKPTGNLEKNFVGSELVFYKIMIIQDQVNLMKLVLKI